VPIRTLPSRAIADASIQAVDIASNSISKAKIDADTRLGLQNDSIILDGTDGASANKGDFLVLDGTDNSSTNANDRILFDETFNPSTFNVSGTATAGDAIKVATAGGFEFGGAGNVLEILSSPCNGTQVTVPSGTYTMADITATQDLTTSFADVTGSSINYTPPSGTTRVHYEFYVQFAYDNDNYAGTQIKFFLDGTEVTDARRSYYGNYFLGGFSFKYTINCNASGANTAHGDITSWTTPKIMKLQAAEYNSSNEARFHRLQLWEGADVSTVVVPTLTITALKDS